MFKSIKWRRISAFLIDIMLVVYLSVAISQVDILNPYKYSYEEAYEEYNLIYNESYDKLTSGEFKPQEFFKKIEKKLYQIERYTTFQYLWYLAFSFLYFGVFAYFTGGQTLGQKLFKLKVVGDDDEKVSLPRMCLRNLFNGTSMSYGVNFIIILNLLVIYTITGSISFFIVNTLLSIIASIYEIAFIIIFMTRKDHKAIHDILFKTKIVEVK